MTNIQLIGNSIVIFLISFVLTNCSNVPVTPDQINVPVIPDQSKEIKSESRYPVIEIWKELDGSVPIRGKSLHFRMYDDGVVEFDYQIRKENRTEKPPVKYSIQRISPAKISEEEFRRFKSFSEDLIKSKDIKQEYRSTAFKFDTEAKLTILLKEDAAERKIITNDSDFEMMEKSVEKKFPKLLINLIKEVHLMRVRLQEKEG